ncbi:MAG TPA: hypothetical protein PK413_05385 [Thermoanaerobaculia bacterium]|mgnify:CR=1 FL=1|nr:hypothetical protein [Thermoanaerobaculia bacterium]
MSPVDATLRQGLLQRFLSGLRFPQLFTILAVLFVVDLLVPDFIPFLDEIFLALATALFASWKVRRQPAGPAEAAPRARDVTPRNP